MEASKKIKIATALSGTGCTPGVNEMPGTGNSPYK